MARTSHNRFVLSSYTQVNEIVDSGARAEKPDNITRFFGGHRRENHPFVSGYWYFYLQPPTSLISPQTAGGATGDPDLADYNSYAMWFHSTAEVFTPPSRTLNKQDITTIGGSGSSYVTGQQLTRTFSVEFREFFGTPVYNIINQWTSIIDPNYGVSGLRSGDYIPANYKGQAFVFICKPTFGTHDVDKKLELDIRDIEHFFHFQGVFPEGAPIDSFNADLSSNDLVRLNISFSFDGWYNEKTDIDAVNQTLTKIVNVANFNNDPLTTNDYFGIRTITPAASA